MAKDLASSKVFLTALQTRFNPRRIDSSKGGERGAIINLNLNHKINSYIIYWGVIEMENELSKRMDRLEKNLDTTRQELSQRMDRIEHRMDKLEEKMETTRRELNGRMDKLEEKLEKQNEKIDRLADKIDELRRDLNVGVNHGQILNLTAVGVLISLALHFFK